MFINFTNHPSRFWSESQREAAGKYGEIIDIPFPEIPPGYTEKEVSELAEKYFQKIAGLSAQAVLCQGEFTFTYQMVRLLKAAGIKAVSACSERNVIETKKGNTTKKEVIFSFVTFREY